VRYGADAGVQTSAQIDMYTGPGVRLAQPLGTEDDKKSALLARFTIDLLLSAILNKLAGL
jgi:hypothetical protein